MKGAKHIETGYHVKTLEEGKIKSNIKPYTGCKKPDIAPAPQPRVHQ